MMNGVQEVQHVAKRLGITNVAAVRKAEEYVRLCKSESCKTIACLGLACKMIGEPFNKEIALKVTKTVDKLYGVAFTSLQNILNVRPELTAEQLATKFGVSAKLNEGVTKTLSRYKEEFIAGLSPLEKGCANFSSIAYLVVAFYLTATGAQMPYQIDKLKLLDFADVQESEFTRIQTSMNELCFGKKSSANPSEGLLNDVLVEKRKREEEDDLSDLEGAEEETVVVPGLKKSTKRVKTEEFEEWKQKVLSKKKQEPPKNVWRQATLTGFVKSCVTTKPKKDNNEADEAKNSTEAKNRTDEDTNTTREDKKEDGNTNEDRSTDSTIYPTTNNQNNKTKDKQLSKGMKKVIASAKKQNINNNNVAKNIKTK